MSFIHVVPPEQNYYPMYSVEYIRKDDPYNCWTQFALTNSRRQVLFLRLECWLRYQRNYLRRVRVL